MELYLPASPNLGLLGLAVCLAPCFALEMLLVIQHLFFFFLRIWLFHWGGTPRLE